MSTAEARSAARSSARDSQTGRWTAAGRLPFPPVRPTEDHMATAAPKKKAKTTYRWAAGKRFNVPAPAAGAAIEAIRAEYGNVTPAAVVDAARSARHPLHKAFNWDDTEAAQKWREHQARMLIGSIRLVVEEDTGPTERIAYVSITSRELGRGYVRSADAMRDPEYRQESITEALAALNGWRERYGHLTDLAEVFEAVDRVTSRRRRAA